ncbi:Uncharacterised protein [Phocoenobacter uteri]|uniref:Fimbrial assembly protein (PilN) n=1 Tax=Phocoenobacter uteri TaxID=146806 RepID=A0A379C6V9_9PAST|nr:hypothetical protein [Phocoenobacter uteri]MDG6881973.1 hypothetical protein [Phocoenobacter uteri]SUB58122.1 Uncharacterised protein [Phocoenobacter uteri]
MEWQGINLTNYHQQNWSNQLKKLGSYSVFFILVMCFIAVAIDGYANKIGKNKSFYQQQNSEIKTQIAEKKRLLQRFIFKQKSKQNVIDEHYIKLILKEIQQLPITGIISEIDIQHHKTDYFELVGKSHNQHDFDKLSSYLNRLAKHKITIDMLKTDSQNQLEFIIKVQKNE